MYTDTRTVNQTTSPHLASEMGTVQFTLVKHAEEAGWAVVSETDALRKRGGESGLFFYGELKEALLRLNTDVVTPENVNSIIQRMESVPKTIEGNKEILEWLRGNRTVYDEKEKRHRNVTLIDYKDLDRNIFQVTYEWTFKSGNRKANRADVVFLVNGVPVAIIENKNPKLADAMERAITQLRRYEMETPEMLTAPQVFNVTHLIEYFYGVTWNYTRKDIVRWKDTRTGERPISYKEAVQNFFDRERFLKMLREWILFYVKDDVLEKTVLRQHQTRATLKVVERCADQAKKSGLIWHTQGSGKTFTLLTAARLILEDKAHFSGATVILIVDRNELEGQLSGWVERLMGEMQGRQISVASADSKAKLQDLLDQDFRGLIVSMIHKFDGLRKDSCTRSDVFVLIDEAHRSTGGDLGNYLMGALPNATLIGFTGTPIDKTAYGKGTFKIFGKEDEKGYLDKYSIRESIADGTTVKLRHTLAAGELLLPEELLEKEFLSIRETEGISDIDDLNRILDRAVTLRAFLKSDDRVDKVAQFVATHFRENIEPLGYKAFLVAVDREACALYKSALDKYLPPEYSLPIYTKNAADVVDRPLVASLQIDETAEKKARKVFPKPDQLPKILIVTDKLLTGYDAPVLYCMYLDKPMRDHVLLQAIARVNRPYEDETGVKKPCGLIVDFVGILKELNKALAFDSDEISGVIEDLDLLLVRFKELMDGPAREYLSKAGGSGGNDERLERLLYETFLDKDERQKFAELFKEVETLYEILSPSPELRDYIEDYNRLADIYVMLRNAYGHKTKFLGDVAHKTETLVRENAAAHGIDRMTEAVDFDEEALRALKDGQPAKNAKIINLARVLAQTSREQAKLDPVLFGIGERAEAILEAMTERQVSTVEALDRLKQLMEEKRALEEERKQTGFDPHTFAIYWTLRREELPTPEVLAVEIVGAFSRFPNYESNTDEMRQLKAEVYKILLPVVGGKRMISLAEQILTIRRK
jgi:type I restriction enzyme R subunit